LSEVKINPDRLAVLRELFGDNRSEWSPDQFKELFVVPPYFKKLESLRPCFLVGGRGTGKTTALQSLHYKATLERLESEDLGFSDQLYLGIHLRLNKNRVKAFQGALLPKEIWAKAFSHYINLLVCNELVKLSEWLELREGKTFPKDSLKRVCSDLAIEPQESLKELTNILKTELSTLQIFVNNPNISTPIFSIAEAPIRSFVEELSDSGLIGERVIYCCFDEYENLLDYQQAILNTYIKHAERPLSYKIGVRKNGFRNRETIDSNDSLQTPDDYAEIEIVDEGFEYFANAVAELRLKRAADKGVPIVTSLSGFLEELTFDEEARCLGAEDVAQKVLSELEGDKKLFEFFNKRPVSDTYFLKYWQESTNEKIQDLANDWISNEEQWKTRIGNHGYASLFWLSKGRKGARIRKYYCGSKVFLSLPAGNIRFFLELIDTAISLELDDPDKVNTWQDNLVISASSQTKAAKEVGLGKLNQLEGLADHGVQLKRLILAIGKVFFELARSPAGKTPEVTSFILSGDSIACDQMRSLLAEGVGYLAIEATPRTIATFGNEIKDEEYRLHPIFSPFFEFSHRRKRRTTFKAEVLLKVMDQPAAAITQLLGEQGQVESKELPTQLAFFSAFYEGGEAS
jgi:hypothetical protein